MSKDFEEYARFFHTNLKVEIGIPISRDEVFREWAMVTDYEYDRISVELSRDQLPSRVRITEGSILDVGIWRGSEVFTCRGIVMERQAKFLDMRLLGGITLRDRRQFYRLNLSLRIKYALPDPHTPAFSVEQEWKERRRHEMEAFRARMGEYDVVLEDVVLPKAPAGASRLEWHDRPDIRGIISGGGIGFRVHRRLQPGDLVSLELHLSLYPFRIVHAVGEVIYVLDPVNLSAKADPAFHTGFKFRFIDERDRDYVIEFISQVELERLRELSARRQVKAADETRLDQDVTTAYWREKLVNIVFVVVFIIAVYLIVTYLISYKSKHHDNELDQQFRYSITH